MTGGSRETLTVDILMNNNINLKELAEEYGLEYLELVSDNMLDPSLVVKLPVEWARSNWLLPVRLNNEICVLTDNPAKVDQQEYLALLIGAHLRPVVAEREVITGSIERCYYSKEDSPGEFLRDMEVSENVSKEIVLQSDDLLQVPKEAPVTQLVNLILLEAVKRNASDIHFEPFESRLRVRYRIDGVLYEQASPPKHLEETLVSRVKVMARMDIAEKRLPQDGMARVRVGEREIDIRVSTIPVAEGERVVLRLLDRDSALLTLSILGMSENTMGSFQNLLNESNGIIVVSGPTGSGKTTTLYAALQQLDAARKNIITIEDPIEYQLPDIGQIQVKPKIGLTFASGLRHILRQDPDIILVGETRDLETAEIAVRASLTGHLVFTTLHTNDAPSAVLRLVDMGVEPYLLASCLRGVLAQRLVRKLCPNCKKKRTVTDRDLAFFGARAQQLTGKTVWGPGGCDSCLEGYKGRTGLFELMMLDAEMQELIRSGEIGADRLREISERKDKTNLLSDGIVKILDGTTSLDEVVNSRY
ncbi:GspE/PulE family protein [Verrucomicrobiota bacterium]